MTRYRARVLTVFIAMLLVVAVWFGRSAPGPDTPTTVNTVPAPLPAPLEAPQRDAVQGDDHAAIEVDSGIVITRPMLRTRPTPGFADIPDIRALMARTSAGDATAAESMFLFAAGCVHERWIDAADAERYQQACEHLALTGAADPLEWLERAVDLGSTYAMRGYFSMHQLYRDRFSELEWQAVMDAARHHLEHARDAGDVDAFFTIAAYSAELIPEGPYPSDARIALAHLYAGATAYRALIAQSDESGAYETNTARGLRELDLARLRNTEENAERLARAFPGLDDDARAIARVLLERCCV